MTDGDLPGARRHRRSRAPPTAAAPVTDSRDLLPAPTTFGGGVSILRGVVYLAVAVTVWLSPDSIPRLTGLGAAYDRIARSRSGSAT